MSTSIRVVLDTNVLVSGIFFAGAPYRVLRAWRDGLLEVVYTPQLLQEIERTLTRIAAALFADPADSLDWLAYIRTFGITVAPAGVAVGTCRDPSDDMLLDAAVAGQASPIVTGDADLLALKSFRGVSLLSPRDFLAAIAATDGGAS